MSGLLADYEQINGATSRNTSYRRPDLPWRIVLHTIEGYSSTHVGFRALAGGHRNAPHLWVDPRAGKRWKLQTVPLDKAARSLARPSGSPETNHAMALQVEIAGRAAETQGWSDSDLDWLGAEVVAPMVAFVRSVGSDIDLDYVERTYGAGEGIVLATVNSPIRHNLPTWYGCNWVTTHQRVIANSHWDAGKLRNGRVLSAAKEALGDTAPSPVLPPKPPTPPIEEITVAEADRIIEQVNLHTDAKVLGLMSFALANQKTGVLWRIEGTKAPWYGRDGAGTYLLDFDAALEFKKLHEITESSATISQTLHDAITKDVAVVNVSGKSIDEIVAAVSEVDADFVNGAIEEAVQRAVQAVQAQLSGDLSKIKQVADLLGEISSGA